MTVSPTPTTHDRQVLSVGSGPLINSFHIENEIPQVFFHEYYTDFTDGARFRPPNSGVLLFMPFK
jgi:hypothetical protein